MAKGSSDDDNDDKLFVAQELAFKYSAGRRRRWYNSNSWKVCHVDARCDDGLPLEPASCPEELSYQSILSIPKCQGSSPGERCIANKDECGIPTDLKNCKKGYHYSSGYYSEYKTYWYSVYEKALGNTRTITTSTTTTVPFVFMVDDGPCTIRHGCVRSPGFPHADLKHESCQISLSPAADLRLVQFRNCTLEPRPFFFFGSFLWAICVDVCFYNVVHLGVSEILDIPTSFMPRVWRGKNAQHKKVCRCDRMSPRPIGGSVVGSADLENDNALTSLEW